MKLALLGTGKIVRDALEALRQVPQIDCSVLFARPNSKEKGDVLAQKYHIPEVLTDYEALLARPDLDFVYVGLVNGVHYEYTKKALLAGKNVILEKPFTPSYAEAAELIQLAEDRGLYLFEAVTLLHMPNFHAIREALPKLGPIRLVQCNYSQYSSRYDAYLEGQVLPAFDPKLYGGALYDINIYNLNFVVGLFGPPDSFQYYPNIGFNGVDTSGALLLRYPTFLAVCTGAKDSESPGYLTIQGETGYLRVTSPPNVLSSWELAVRNEPEQININHNQHEHRMVHEFLEFAETFARKDYDQMRQGLAISQEVVKIAEQASKNAGLNYGITEKGCS